MNHPSADQLTINSRFAVPVGVNFLPDSEKLNDALKTLILTKKQDHKVKNLTPPCMWVILYLKARLISSHGQRRACKN